MVTVKYFASLRDEIGERNNCVKENDSETENANTVGELLERLISKYGNAIYQYLYGQQPGIPSFGNISPEDENSSPYRNPTCIIAVDGNPIDITKKSGLDIALEEQSVVAIFPQVGGG